MVIACIGDSSTFGQNVRADQAWPHLLWEMTGHDVRNLGVNGDTTRLALERFKRDVELSKPDVVIIQLGHNDANLWDGRPRVSRAAYVANTAELVSRSFLLGVAQVLIIEPHDAPGREPTYAARVKAYREALQDIPEYKATPEIEVALLDDGYGVHPSPAGHLAYADALRRMVSERPVRAEKVAG